MSEIILEFKDSGGYDSMTGAWEIFVRDGKFGHQTLANIDQSDFGQEHCDFEYRSPEAERVARICYEALRREYGIPKD